MKKLIITSVLWSTIWLLAPQISAQALTGYYFKLVNMIPNAQSNETNYDSETNIAVNKSNTSQIVGSAFTRNPTGSTTTAPIFVSGNTGTTWALNNIVPSGNGMTGDISVDFSGSNVLYAGILRGGSGLRCMVLRTNNPSGAATMTTLLDRSGASVDQPYAAATTVGGQDRIFIGDNNLSAANGRTAEIMVSNNATTAPPSGIAIRNIERRNTNGQDYPPIRTAIHSSGVVYGIFYRWISGNTPNGRCDVVVVRDNNFASGATQFAALTDPSDGLAGRLVVTNRLVPAFAGASFGNNRLVGSNLSIAVDPDNSNLVYIAWCDRVSTNDYTIHMRRSTDAGQSWGSDVLTVTNATNPAIAVATNDKVAIMYQQLVGSGGTARWETHFRLAPLNASSFTDDILSSFLASDLLASTISPSLGDYMDMEAVGDNFYAVFPASNNPAAGNWPLKMPTYQRNVNFSTGQLRNLANTGNVSISVDPYFVSITPRLIFNICEWNPRICRDLWFGPVCKLPPFPCFRCPGPICLTCPFELPFEEIIRNVLPEPGQFKTRLATPYYHLFLDGYDPKSYKLSVVNAENEEVVFRLNKTEKGYAISIRPSKANYNQKEGLKGLKILALPFDAESAKKGVEIPMRLEISDYPLKEHLARKR